MLARRASEPPTPSPESPRPRGRPRRNAAAPIHLDNLLATRRRFRASLQLADPDHRQSSADFVDLLASAIRAEGFTELNEEAASKL